tara:strand:+ start:280 stop:735 length:456 start_codon:yes stop_codon:yes gene_type:complete
MEGYYIEWGQDGAKMLILTTTEIDAKGESICWEVYDDSYRKTIKRHEKFKNKLTQTIQESSTSTTYDIDGFYNGTGTITWSDKDNTVWKRMQMTYGQCRFMRAAPYTPMTFVVVAILYRMKEVFMDFIMFSHALFKDIFLLSSRNTLGKQE